MNSNSRSAKPSLETNSASTTSRSSKPTPAQPAASKRSSAGNGPASVSSPPTSSSPSPKRPDSSSTSALGSSTTRATRLPAGRNAGRTGVSASPSTSPAGNSPPPTSSTPSPPHSPAPDSTRAWLTLELTESTLIDDAVGTQTILRELRALGRQPLPRRLRHRLLVPHLPARAFRSTSSRSTSPSSARSEQNAKTPQSFPLSSHSPRTSTSPSSPKASKPANNSPCSSTCNAPSSRDTCSPTRDPSTTFPNWSNRRRSTSPARASRTTDRRARGASEHDRRVARSKPANRAMCITSVSEDCSETPLHERRRCAVGAKSEAGNRGSGGTSAWSQGTRTERFSARTPGGGLSPYTTMWVVRVGNELYVRSAGGPDRPWYRRAKTSGGGRIRAGGIERDVVFGEADPGSHGDIDAAYRAKYDSYGPTTVGHVIGKDARPVTIRLQPRTNND